MFLLIFLLSLMDQPFSNCFNQLTRHWLPSTYPPGYSHQFNFLPAESQKYESIAHMYILKASLHTTTWTHVNSKCHLDIFLSNSLFVLYQWILIWKKNMLLLIFLLSLMDQHFFKDAYYPTIKVNQHYKYLKHSLDVNTYLDGQQVEVNYLESLRRCSLLSD